MKICFEKSGTEIYDRIVFSLAKGFGEHGHECVYTEATYQGDVQAYIDQINQCELVIISHIHGFLSRKSGERYLYEFVKVKLAFIHHDAPSYSPTFNLAEIYEKLVSFQRTPSAIHFSIERDDVDALKAIGVTCYPINHINSIGVLADENQRPSRSIAFVGHVFPPEAVNLPIDFGTRNDHCFLECYKERLADATYSVKGDFERRSDSKNTYSSPLEHFALRVLFVMRASSYSLIQRGELIGGLDIPDIHIFGGDPSARGLQEGSRKIQSKNIRYHPHVYRNDAVAKIFSSAAININITSMQFDTAVVNRVLDCVGSGGFILTDRKSSLTDITSVAEEISFSSATELSEKLSYFLDPVNQRAYREIKKQVLTDINEKCSAESVAMEILAHL